MIQAGNKLDPSWHHYIRLERLHVNSSPHENDIVLDGVVEDREYYGLYIKYYVKSEGQTLKIIEKNDGVHLYDAGEKIRISFSPSDLMSYAPKGDAS